MNNTTTRTINLKADTTLVNEDVRVSSIHTDWGHDRPKLELKQGEWAEYIRQEYANGDVLHCAFRKVNTGTNQGYFSTCLYVEKGRRGTTVSRTGWHIERMLQDCK